MVTPNEVALARMVAETIKCVEESRKLCSESTKLQWEGSKYRRETLYYPFVAGVAMAGTIGAAVFALVKQFLQ